MQYNKLVKLLDTDITNLGDSTVRVSLWPELLNYSNSHVDQVWSTNTLELLYVIDPYLETGAGDLFSLSWSSALQTVYVGCQNTSLQWYNFREPPAQSRLSPTISETELSMSDICTPTTIASRKAHKFFDSYPQYERKPADLNAKNGTPKHSCRGSPDLGGYLDLPRPRENVAIPASNVIDSAHYGYIYCMTIISEGDRGVHLATGSGDETVKVMFMQTL